MNQYSIGRNGKVLGEFSPEEIKDKLNSGQLRYDDLAFTEGYEEWKEIGSIPEFSSTEIRGPEEVDKINGGKKKVVIGITTLVVFLGVGLAVLYFAGTFWGGKPDLARFPEIEKQIRHHLTESRHDVSFSSELTETDFNNVLTLDLQYTKITDASLKEVAKLQNLEELGLRGAKITDAGLKEVGKLQNLEELDLRGAKITDAGLKGLAKLQNLTKLNLEYTKITDAGLKEVGKLQNLTKLDLEYTKITDAGLKELAKLQSLTHLYLSNTQITDEGLKEVAKLQSLTSLILSDTQITDEGLKEVAKLQNLDFVSLWDTQITRAGVDDLKKALPNCLIRSNLESNRP